VYDVTQHSIFPNDGIDDTAKLAELLSIVPDGSTIHFPPGDYNSSPPGGLTDQISVTGRAGLTLEGDATQQSRLLFANRTGRALHIANCSNLKVRDLVLEYTAPSWTQGQLKGWDTSPLHNWIDILVSPGYES